MSSMAVNSVSKKVLLTDEKAVKDASLLNGLVIHATSGKQLYNNHDSSGSDPDRKTSSPKSVATDMKRKKGSRKPVLEESKRKKLSTESTDSERESVSDKDSDSDKKSDVEQNDKSGEDSGKKRCWEPNTNLSTLQKNEGGKFI